jgi:hypothetical protein
LWRMFRCLIENALDTRHREWVMICRLLFRTDFYLLGFPRIAVVVVTLDQPTIIMAPVKDRPNDRDRTAGIVKSLKGYRLWVVGCSEE